MALFKKKDKGEEEDLSVINDYKEPFTWATFWDEKVIGRYKAIVKFLQVHGISYFFFSPFQYKNRLILKLVLIFTGIMIGVVPRSMHMISEAKERNASSEIANVTGRISSGDITIEALAAGQYERTHLLVFNIEGDTAEGVPSTTSGFDVTLSKLRGVGDASKVKYQYTVLPLNQANRLLLVYIDNTKQNDKTGIYGLDIHMKGADKMKTPMEIVLSDNQKSTAVYKNGKIKLSALSDALLNINDSDNTPIKDAEEALDSAMNVYKVNEDRLEASSMTIGMTTDKLQKFVDSQLILSNLNDKSTTDDISDSEPEELTTPVVSSSITYKGKTYTDTDVDKLDSLTTDSSSTVTKTNIAKDTELPNLTKLVQDVQTAVSALNSARLNKYKALSGYESVLSQQITPSDMTKAKTVK